MMQITPTLQAPLPRLLFSGRTPLKSPQPRRVFPIIRIRDKRLASARFVEINNKDKPWLKAELDKWPEHEGRIFLARSIQEWHKVIDKHRDGTRFFAARRGNRLLGLAETSFSPGLTNLTVLDIHPNQVHDNKQRTFKGLGRGMVWGLLHEAKDRIVKFTVDAGAEGFYDNVFGKENPYKDEAYGQIQSYYIPPTGVVEAIKVIEQRPEYLTLFKNKPS